MIMELSSIVIVIYYGIISLKKYRVFLLLIFIALDVIYL